MSYHVGDTAPPLTGALTDGSPPNVTAKDITGATLEVHVRRPDGSVINRPGVVVDPSGGEWSMDIEVGDLVSSGTYRVEVQVTYAGGGIQTFGEDRMFVKPQLA